MWVQVYGSSVSYVSHESDVWRADILYKYGGVYVDADAVIVQPLTDEMRSYEAVVAYDWPQWYPPFPDIFNLGVTTGKPGSRFWQLCLVLYFCLRVYAFNTAISFDHCRRSVFHIEPVILVMCTC